MNEIKLLLKNNKIKWGIASFKYVKLSKDKVIYSKSENRLPIKLQD